MRSRSGPGRASLTSRLVLHLAVAFLVVMGIFALVLALAGDDAGGLSPVLTLLAAGLGLGVGSVVVVLWAKRAMAPITDLTALIEALGRGDHQGALPRSPIKEIDELSLAIARLEDESQTRLIAAERSSATLEVVLGALPEGTILFDEADRVVYANPSAYTLLGVVPDALSGLTPFPFQGAVRECRVQRTQTTRVVEHGKPVRTLRGVATPFADDQRVLLIVADVTDVERVAAVRRDFVANASHELKTPVSAIIASSEALRIAVERGDESAIRFAGQIEASARQLDRLVADLLDLSRLERDQPELDPLHLELLVKDEVERIRQVAQEREVTVTCEVEPVWVSGSRRDIAIAIRNLLDNAIRYTPSSGSVSVELNVEGSLAVLRIRDTGEGIPTRDLTRVFERFYRVDNARARATGGTGLGLAIVKHVIENHGGSVEVESELGVGSTFIVHLPVLERDSTSVQLA